MPADELRPRPTGPPEPGDPRDPGPRPAGGPRDLGWAALAAGLVVVTAAQLVALVAVLVRTGASGGGAVLGFLVTVVWLLTISWLVLGAWRRTVWGCPFAHEHDAVVDRRCARHRLLGPPG